jgi:hypothetical protein
VLAAGGLHLQIKPTRKREHEVPIGRSGHHLRRARGRTPALDGTRRLAGSTCSTPTGVGGVSNLPQGTCRACDTRLLNSENILTSPNLEEQFQDF